MCGCIKRRGFQMAVAVVSKVHTPQSSGERRFSEMHSFAKTLHKDWDVGYKSCDNGILLLLAIDQRFA